LLQTASDDGTVKLWIIPEDGVTKDIHESDAELRGHAKKVIISRFHPSADCTIASVSADNTVRIWDVQQQKCVTTYEEIKNFSTGLEWSHNGSLLACITKDKLAYAFDPRKEGKAMSVSTHEGTRP
jgi:WD40 repeat protein